MCSSPFVDSQDFPNEKITNGMNMVLSQESERKPALITMRLSFQKLGALPKPSHIPAVAQAEIAGQLKAFDFPASPTSHHSQRLSKC
jgi:hypothetical protein